MKCLVFSGGAEKGIAYIGIFKFLEEHNLLKDIESIYGTSIGAVMAVLVSIGYTSRELEYVIYKTNIKELIPTDILNIEQLLSTFGFIEPHKFYKLIRLLIEKKTGISNITFKQHFNKYKKKIIITGSCISEYKCYYFSIDTFPDLSIFEALTISTSIPIMFKPITFENKLFVDGAVYDNYPIQHATKHYKLNDILGILILMDYCHEPTIQSIDKYLLVLFKSIDIKFNYLPIQLYGEFTISIPIKETINTYDEETIRDLINIGYESISSYYKNNKNRFIKKNIVKLNSIDYKYNDK
jgi:predicted acylesterase/phospholipase RssA